MASVYKLPFIEGLKSNWLYNGTVQQRPRLEARESEEEFQDRPVGGD